MGTEEKSRDRRRENILNGICPICGAKRLQEFGDGWWLCRECSAVIEEEEEEDG